jgi:hypothetical protein
MPDPFLRCNKHILCTPRFSISVYPGHHSADYVKQLIVITETGSR